MSFGFQFVSEQNNKRAVLLCHGLTGSPFEMKKFGKYVADNGYDTFCVCLPGHGEKQAEIYTVTYEEWQSHMEKAFQYLCENYEEVFPYGGEGKGVCKVRRNELGTEGSGTGVPTT